MALQNPFSSASVVARQAALSEINDFEPESDALVCIWDDAEADSPPELRILPDPDHAGQLRICLGRRTVAHVSGPQALRRADVTVMPLSSARAVGLADDGDGPLH